MPKITRALISVYYKTGIVDFAKGLTELGVALISTGGTAKALRDAGLKVTDISEVTGFPEMLDGRVKTLHPKVHGGLLYRRELDTHRAQIAQHGIEPIDLVVVNLYPFEETVAKPGIGEEECIEQIDIGGPSMLRSAAKNWESVTVLCDAADYAEVLEEIREGHGHTKKETRLRLAEKVFATTSRYDGAIAAYLAGVSGGPAPSSFSIHGVLRQPLRYGENPHQKAAFYAVPGVLEPNLASGKQLSGKELSFNNILDLSAALEIVKEFAQPCACVIKHHNPCGCAISARMVDAFKLAYAGDPLSAFGGVLGFNRPVEADVAAEIAAPDRFVEAIVAPGFTKEAAEILTTKPKWGKSVRLVEVGPFDPKTRAKGLKDVRCIPGGLLVQDRDLVADEWAELQTVTKRAPTAEEVEALKFAQLVCKHVKSNAIVFAKGTQLVGTGAGQMSRVDSVEIAAKKAGPRAKGAVMASDAFFPFPDGVEAAAKAGVTAVIQPGGSVKDEEVIAVCNKLGLAMVTTGIRHFKH